jgi:hypothetical protein
MIRSLTAAAFLALAACASPPAPGASVTDWSTVVIRLERGPCMGGCPIYSIEIHGDGSVAYEGVNFVDVTGRQTGQVPVEDVRALVARLEAARFTRLRDEYRSEISDGVTYRTTFSHDGRSKTVVNYVGHQVGMPQSVGEIEGAIDQAAGARRWVGANR